ncbi:LysR substrate-binding domain-containing protein [Variovorax sp. J22R133]|uniref:LysR substrate-binding domain-containing protein n=1 Tax=Variovorax brevis TaxID=3053503 RepID=UPI002574FD3B|nr:LysR substrate-binding domain-containing protein [Variovorax sp. J22R133]MDM0113837.1 LysR substrate-binding domain-containing protein [Variovorax sp. J22R133]
MRFDLTDLRLFANIVEAGTITGGAAQTHMTLASASQRVIAMEDELGTPLLLRAKQGVRPTEAGRTLAHHAVLVLQQLERMRAELGDYGAGLQGHVRLLCNTSAMTEHVPAALSEFLAAHPRVSVDLEEQSSIDIVDAVRAGQCDIGIVSDAVDVEGLQHFVFRRDDLMVAVPRGHALARRRRLTLAELVDFEFVGLAAGNPLQEHVAQHARRLGKRLRYRVRVRSFEALCRMVEQGIGIGIVPKAAAERCALSMKIGAVALVDQWAARHLLACVRDANALPLNAQRMLEQLLKGAPLKGDGQPALRSSPAS